MQPFGNNTPMLLTRRTDRQSHLNLSGQPIAVDFVRAVYTCRRSVYTGRLHVYSTVYSIVYTAFRVHGLYTARTRRQHCRVHGRSSVYTARQYTRPCTRFMYAKQLLNTTQQRLIVTGNRNKAAWRDDNTGLSVFYTLYFMKLVIL